MDTKAIVDYVTDAGVVTIIAEHTIPGTQTVVTIGRGVLSDGSYGYVVTTTNDLLTGHSVYCRYTEIEARKVANWLWTVNVHRRDGKY